MMFGGILRSQRDPHKNKSEKEDRFVFHDFRIMNSISKIRSGNYATKYIHLKKILPNVETNIFYESMAYKIYNLLPCERA